MPAFLPRARCFSSRARSLHFSPLCASISRNNCRPMKDGTGRTRSSRRSTSAEWRSWLSQWAGDTNWGSDITIRRRDFRGSARESRRSNCRADSPSLTRHDDFGDGVLGEELLMAGPAGKEPLDAAISEGALNGIRIGGLDFDVVRGGDVIAAMRGFIAGGAGMEESEHLSAGMHGAVEVRDDGKHKGLGQGVK